MHSIGLKASDDVSNPRQRDGLLRKLSRARTTPDAVAVVVVDSRLLFFFVTSREISLHNFTTLPRPLSPLSFLLSGRLSRESAENAAIPTGRIQFGAGQYLRLRPHKARRYYFGGVKLCDVS